MLDDKDSVKIVYTYLLARFLEAQQSQDTDLSEKIHDCIKTFRILWPAEVNLAEQQYIRKD